MPNIYYAVFDGRYCVNIECVPAGMMRELIDLSDYDSEEEARTLFEESCRLLAPDYPVAILVNKNELIEWRCYHKDDTVERREETTSTTT